MHSSAVFFTLYTPFLSIPLMLDEFEWFVSTPVSQWLGWPVDASSNHDFPDSSQFPPTNGRFPPSLVHKRWFGQVLQLQDDVWYFLSHSG